MLNDKKTIETENEERLAEKMRERLHQSYNVECHKTKSKEKK